MQGSLSTERMCRLAEVSRAGFYLVRMCLHPFLPTGNIVVLRFVKTVANTGHGIVGRFVGFFAKSKR
jgi:hypothetical protein